MPINKVEYKQSGVTNTLLDLTGDTAVEADVIEGKQFHKADGSLATGTAKLAIPIEIATDAEMAAVLIAANVGKCYKFTGTTGTYTNGNLYVVESV